MNDAATESKPASAPNPSGGVIQSGDVVQIVDTSRVGLTGAFVLVDEVKSWGVQGFVHQVESFDEAKQIWLRLNWYQIERVGQAAMVLDDTTTEEGQQ